MEEPLRGGISDLLRSLLEWSNGDCGKTINCLTFPTWGKPRGGALSATRAAGSTTPSPALRGSPYHPESVAARVRREYRANPAHNPRSPYFNPQKTPEPADALSVYQGATRAGMGTWYGRGNSGWYRYSSDNAGGVHFSGLVPESQVPAAILRVQ